MRNSLVSFLFILLVSQMVMSEESQSPCSRPCVIGGFAGTCTSNCPPCYIANGGGFHCFDKANGACPWPGMTDCSAQSHPPPPPPPRQPPPPAPRPNPPPSPRPAQQQQQQPQQSSGSRRVLRHLEFLNVGGSGTYNRITNMIPNSGAWNQCANPGDKCHRSPVQVSGPLAPFHEDLTLALRGPMEVHNIAVYVPNGGSWKRVSDWGRGSSGNNLIWMANRGGTPFPGDWSICHGNSQTFASVDGKGAAHNPQAFSGNLGNDVNVNIMSGTRCKNVPVGDNGDNCPGYERGVAYEGWRGNSCGEKMFVIRAKMPNDRSGSNNNNLPAVWLLNGQVVRTNQWGCNCRGVGASGGCGEFDIVEAIPGRSDQDLTTTLYSFKQSLGANQVFGRPVNRIATYLTIFEGAGSGKIHVIEIPDGDFSFADNIPHGDILSWARSSNGPKETVTLGNPYQGQCANSIFRSNPQPAPRATAPPPTPRPAVPRPAPRPATPPPQQQQKPNPVPVPKNNACAKRGMAYTFASAADMDTVKNGISWWYNWASQPVAAEQGHTRHGIEFVPMIWGERFLQNTVPAQSRFVLGFNEPNFFAQANIAAPRAASLWPRIEQTAQHRSTVSPAVNFCGGNPGCHDTDPFVYLDKFFSNCKNCKVDYIAVHWYACTGDALKWYLDRLRKYNKKVWVTEIACAPWDGNYKPGLDFQINYMREAIRILENDPMVVRYAWFSGRTTEIPDVNIFESQPGQLTRLGREYISQPCGRAQALQGSDESYTSQQTSPTKTGAGFALLGVLVSMLILLAVLLIMGLLYVFVRTRAKTEERV